MSQIRRALISVSNKDGIVELARNLQSLGVEILSTGGTAKVLRETGIPIIEVSDYTGFPEMMDGRLKTLHPKIEGGILGRRGIDDSVMEEHDIPPIDLVVCNLYPFKKTVAKKDCTFEDAIENIDIGGPTMIRAAAKNHKDVVVIVDPNDYNPVIQMMDQNNGTLSDDFRLNLALKVFDHTHKYDAVIADYLREILTKETVL